MILDNYPLISCLCITRNKVSKLRRAINCFLNQTYPRKELIIVYEDMDESTRFFAESSQFDNTRFIKVRSVPKLSLGELRNISLDMCSGDYFCQWDDDDWYHDSRLNAQISAAIANRHPASALTNWLVYDEHTGQAYLSYVRLWEGSILCKMEVVNTLGLRYPAAKRGEDAVFFKDLLKKSRVFPIVSPNLYVYVYHGGNTWPYSHFMGLFTDSQRLPDFLAALLRKILNEEMPVSEASRLLESDSVLEQFDFFYSVKSSDKYLLDP